MDDIGGRILNPVVLATLVVAGLAYGRVLWSLNLRPTTTLVVTAIAPGAIFLVTIWLIRSAQGTPSLIWPALLADYLVYSTSGVLAVLVARRRTKR